MVMSRYAARDVLRRLALLLLEPGAVTSDRFQEIVQDLKNGILLYQNGSWTPFLQNTCLSPNSLITSFIRLGADSSVIATLKDGLYMYQNGKLAKISSPDLNALSSEIIYKAIPVDVNRIAIATNWHNQDINCPDCFQFIISQFRINMTSA